MNLKTKKVEVAAWKRKDEGDSQRTMEGVPAENIEFGKVAPREKTQKAKIIRKN